MTAGQGAGRLIAMSLDGSGLAVRSAASGDDLLTPTSLARLWAAAFIDALLGFCLWIVCAIGLLKVWGYSAKPFELPATVLPVLLALAVALHLLYHVSLIGRSGQTLGKGALGIAVVKRDGSRPGYFRAALRSLGGMFAVLTLGIANMGVLVTRERRGIGDWLAETRVVRVPSR